MKKKYLIALDGSENAEYALSWSLENLINPSEDELLILSVGMLTDGNPYEYTAATRHILNGDELKLQRQQAEEQARKYVNKGKKIVSDFLYNKEFNQFLCEYYVNSSSDPANYIVDFVRENKVDVLVLGRRGVDQPEAVSVGSVSKYCLHSVMCTVVIVRRKTEIHKDNIAP
ncbi:13562_t:CDS:2 [Acaulospora morrowiae]|uniref:13562_t:CDS:1 n=1 Tax=Acaulospora morrowiae TaxID=94023 RepID=A0A9N9G2A9_9GLOM|nr:13562_t:CDS:2 [Acaulospora morrowiae]